VVNGRPPMGHDAWMRSLAIACVVLVAGCQLLTEGGVPPSGDYTVTVRVIADDCEARYVPPEPWQAEVHRQERKGKVVVNVPLSALPPSNSTNIEAQSNIVLVPPEPQTRERPRGTHPPCLEQEHVIEPTAVSSSGFTLRITAKFGERTPMCKPSLPQHCTTTIEQVFRRVKKQ